MAESPNFTTKSTSRSGPNVSSGWIVMVLSGLIAVVIFFVVTAQGSTTNSVLVAAHDIAPGEKVDSSSFRTAQVKVDQAQLNRLIGDKDKVTYNGYVATGPITSGELVNKSALLPASGRDATSNRTMSFSLDKTRAANGELKSGDRIDIIDEGSKAGGALFSATNILVTGVTTSSGGGGLAGGASSFVLTVSVTSDQALALANTLQNGKIDIIRSTGAAPVDASSTSTTTTTVAPK